MKIRLFLGPTYSPLDMNAAAVKVSTLYVRCRGKLCERDFPEEDREPYCFTVTSLPAPEDVEVVELTA